MTLNFADLFEHAADAFGDRIAVACGDSHVTYRELEERVNRLAHHLTGIGVGPGDHVGLYARNSIEATETLIAACKLRAAAVNINYRYVESELRYMLADSDPAALVYDRQFAPRVAAAAEAAPGLRGAVVIDDGSEAGADASVPGTDYAAALAAASPERDFPLRSNDDVYIIYTGGTTGYPKGVMWRHEDIWRTLAGGIDFTTGIPLPDEWEQSRRGRETGGMVKLCAAPLIHGNAQVAALAGLFCGDTVVLLPRFDAHEIWRAVERRKVNLLVIIGDAMARPLIEAYHAGGYDASSLIAISSSAALFSPVVKDACAQALPNVVITEAIGSSETGFGGLTFVTPGAEHRGGPTVTPGPDTIVLDDDDRPAGPGQVGRLARGGHVPLGYYKDPVKTAALFTEMDGKRYTVPGDLARVEADGTVTLLGRGNTCVNTGGEKVFPEEVEGALKSHADVFDALVIGVPDARLGQRVGALVQPREGRVPDLTAIEAHLRRQIAGYKLPRSIWLVDAIGRAPSGKPDYSWARRYAANRPATAEHPDAEHPAAEHPAPEHPAAEPTAQESRAPESPATERPVNAVSSTTGGHPAA
jgi:3-oxocholest-4-en-26-oate---CoA ligase